MMSLVRVINGPVAKAGSIFMRLSSRGKAVPKMDAKIITTNRAIVTVMGMAKVGIPKDSDNRKIIAEQIAALI